MLYWAIFTCGFIVGGVFAAFVLTPKNSEEQEPFVIYPKISEDLTVGDPDKLFEHLTQINYPQDSIGPTKNSAVNIGS